MAEVTTVLNQVLIDETGVANIPSTYYYTILILAWILFLASLWIRNNDDITAILAAVFFAIVTALTPYVEFIYVNFIATSNETTDHVYVASAAYHPQAIYMATIWGLMFLIAVINVWRIWVRNLKESAQVKLQKEQMEYDMERQRRGI